MHFCGFSGMMRHIYDHTTYTFLQQMVPWNVFVTAAAILLFVAQAIFLVNVAWSAWRGARVGENPWDSQTLEWSAPNRPPHGNWPGEIPEVVCGPYEYGGPEPQPQWALPKVEKNDAA
jgi:cytochrome c oxidase subunit 1